MAQQKTDWNGIIAGVNEFMRILKRKPCSLKSMYSLNPSSILNAFLEGDLTFNQAVRALNKWKKR